MLVNAELCFETGHGRRCLERIILLSGRDEARADMREMASMARMLGAPQDLPDGMSDWVWHAIEAGGRKGTMEGPGYSWNFREARIL